ncbi:MAG: hypothetical protein AAGB19_18925, partial [Cyanobacteria bacterium P01_F01_bin.3]
SVAMRRRGSTQREGPRNRDYTLSEVHQLDFSDFSEPGEYRLCVESVGLFIRLSNRCRCLGACIFHCD